MPPSHCEKRQGGALSNFLKRQSIQHGYNIEYMYVCNGILHLGNFNDAINSAYHELLSDIIYVL